MQDPRLHIARVHVYECYHGIFLGKVLEGQGGHRGAVVSASDNAVVSFQGEVVLIDGAFSAAGEDRNDVRGRGEGEKGLEEPASY